MKEIVVDFIRDKIVNDDKAVLIDADLGKCLGSTGLHKEFPERCFNVGIAEQNMVSIAAGLSSYGFIPFIHSFAPFVTRRVADQVMISVCYAKQNVKIIGTDPGIAAELNGGTHMPFEDIGILRSIPGIVIYEPTDNAELNALLPDIYEYKGPVYIRLFRKCPPAIYDENEKFNLFKAKIYKEGTDVTLIASGLMVKTAIDAAAELEKDNISAEVIISPTVKPIDAGTIITSAQKTGAVVTCENHNVIGGLRSAVAEVLSENSPVIMQSVGVKEKFGEVGKMAYLRKVYRMETGDVVDAAKKAVAAKL